MDFSNVLIKRGTIFHSYNFDDIGHGKFFVIVGENENNYVGYFFINSKINSNISRNQDFFSMQMPIRRSFYPDFLIKDSWVDLHEITTIPKNELSEQIKNNTMKYKGNLTKEDETLMLESLRSSKIYSKKHKDIFFK
jgi:hypothetical protein